MKPTDFVKCRDFDNALVMAKQVNAALPTFPVTSPLANTWIWHMRLVMLAIDSGKDAAAEITAANRHACQ